MAQRNHAFDFLCGVCILRMFMNHITSFCGFSDSDWWTGIYYWTFYFISFFFFKAGYFNKTTSGDTRRYCLNKARQLLVPYFSWGLIGCVVYFSMMYLATLRFHHFIETVTWAHIWETSGFFGNSSMWFLLSFFVSYIVMHLLGKVRGLLWVVLLFPFVSYLLFTCDNPLWFSLNNVFMCIYIFQLGNFWHRVLDRLSRFSAVLLSLLLIAAFCVSNVVFHGEFIASGNTWTGHPVAVVANVSLMLCGLSGLLLSVRLPRIPLINYIGEHSMVYFVAHYPMIVFYRFLRISFGRSIQGRWEDWILMMIVVPIICSWLVPYVEKTPWLSGRFRKSVPATQPQPAA